MRYASAPDGQLLINKGDTWAFYALDSHKKAFTIQSNRWNVVSFVRLSVMVTVELVDERSHELQVKRRSVFS